MTLDEVIKAWELRKRMLQTTCDTCWSEDAETALQALYYMKEMEEETVKLPNYKLCTLHLHPEKDADIIRWLDAQRLADTKTNAIRKLIRKQIRQEIREKLEGKDE